MKILWVRAGRLFPLNTGGRIRSYHIMSRIAQQHELKVFTFYREKEDKDYEQEVARHFPGAATLFLKGHRPALLGRALEYLRFLPRPTPYAVSQFFSNAARLSLAHSLQVDPPNVVVCDFPDAGVNLPQVISKPSVLFQHNVETEIWRREARVETNWIKKAVYTIEARKMACYEGDQVRRFDHVIAVSERDRVQMARIVDVSRITVIPTGVDLSQFDAAAEASQARSVVVFLGSMDWEANIDAVAFFCQEIWPRVLQQVPEAIFRIVGRNPGPRIKALAGSSIEVTGTVPNVANHLAEAAVVVVPLRIGGGTRIKIYEAMAMARPVVSTNLGAEGLDVTHGRDIFLADDPSGFAEAVTLFLRSPELRQQYGRAASNLARKYDWSVISGQFAQVLEQVASVASRKATPSYAKA